MRGRERGGEGCSYPRQPQPSQLSSSPPPSRTHVPHASDSDLEGVQSLGVLGTRQSASTPPPPPPPRPLVPTHENQPGASGSFPGEETCGQASFGHARACNYSAFTGLHGPLSKSARARGRERPKASEEASLLLFM